MVKGTVVMGVGLLVSLMGRRLSAAVRHSVWMAVMGVMLVLPAMEAGPGWRVAPRWHWGEAGRGANVIPAPSMAPAMPEATAEMAVPEPAAKGAAALAMVKQVVVNEAVTERPANVRGGESMGWAAWVMMLWGAGLVGMLVPMGLAVAWGRRVVRGGKVLGGRWGELVEEARRVLGIKGRAVRVVESRRVGVPLVLGARRPVIVVPVEAEEWGDEKRRMVVMHEMAHVRRRDVLTHAMAGVVRAVYWFHPLVWFGYWQMALERERACDDRVVMAARGEGAAYARVLIEIAAGMNKLASNYGGVGMARKTTLEARVRAVMDGSRRREAVGWQGLALIGVMAVGVGVPLGMVRAAGEPSDQGAAATMQLSAAEKPGKTGDFVTFSDGEKVQLLAITTNGAGGPWWQPNGAPTIPPVGISAGAGGDNLLLLFKVTGVEGRELLPVIDMGAGAEPKSLSSAQFGTPYFYTFLHRSRPLRLGEGRGEWKQEMKLDPGGSEKNEDGAVAVGQSLNGSVQGIPIPSEEIATPSGEKSCCVMVAHTFDPSKMAWRLVAIDANGKEFPSAGAKAEGICRR